MKLPNFLEDPELNRLRAQMGAKDLGTFRLSVNPYRFTVSELEQLIVDGIDVRYLDEVRALPDGTLCYKDRRVLLFTRDAARAAVPGPADALPPYHFSNCAVVRDLREQASFVRHAVSAREDGQFQVNFVQGTLIKRTLTALPACPCCLIDLAFDASPGSFVVPRFFEKYRRNLAVENQEAGGDTGRFPKL
ncbi:MAG: hypothetical protein JSS24_11110 [Proteobacteria bacterium]|nr:hypothetical protein [Pseudomonadota bacterium]